MTAGLRLSLVRPWEQSSGQQVCAGAQPSVTGDRAAAQVRSHPQTDIMRTRQICILSSTLFMQICLAYEYVLKADT